MANETPVPFYETAKIVLHMIPIISFNPAQSYDISIITSQPKSMLPIGFQSGGFSYRYNLDGFFSYSGGEGEESHPYVQLYRNGIIEAVEGALLAQKNTGQLIIYSPYYEEKLIKSLTEYLLLLNKLNVELPIFIFLTLLGVKGYSMGVDKSRYSIPKAYTIDRDVLSLPEVIVDSYDMKAEEILKPCFDSIWNACGFARSFNYNENGEWAPR
jgi:hypothetical protein